MNSPQDHAQEATPRRVLLIDDDRLVISSLRRFLEPHLVSVALSGVEALEAIARDVFDVYVCDLMMPNMTGMELYGRICDEKPELARRFVFMTGGVFNDEARTFLAGLPNRWLEKPFDPEQLARLVQDFEPADPD